MSHKRRRVDKAEPLWQWLCERVLPELAGIVVEYAQSFLLATGCQDGTVRVWDMATGTEYDACPGDHTRPSDDNTRRIEALAFHPKTLTLASAWHHTVRLWPLGQALSSAHSLPHKEKVSSLTYTPDGQQLLSGVSNGHGYDWEMATLTVSAAWNNYVGPPLLPHERRVHDMGGIYSVVVSPNGQLLATMSRRPGLVVRDRATMTVLHVFRNVNGHAAFSHDSRRIAAGTYTLTSRPDPYDKNYEISVWDVTTGELTHVFQHIFLVPVRRVSFSPDGQTLVSMALHGAVKLWALSDTTTCLAIFRPLPPSRRPFSMTIAFSPDGRMFALEGDDQVFLYDMATQQPRGMLSHSDKVYSMVVSPRPTVCYPPESM